MFSILKYLLKTLCSNSPSSRMGLTQKRTRIKIYSYNKELSPLKYCDFYQVEKHNYSPNLFTNTMKTLLILFILKTNMAQY